MTEEPQNSADAPRELTEEELAQANGGFGFGVFADIADKFPKKAEHTFNHMGDVIKDKLGL